jgi:hypothetical protein
MWAFPPALHNRKCNLKNFKIYHYKEFYLFRDYLLWNSNMKLTSTNNTQFTGMTRPLHSNDDIESREKRRRRWKRKASWVTNRQWVQYCRLHETLKKAVCSLLRCQFHVKMDFTMTKVFRIVLPISTALKLPNRCTHKKLIAFRHKESETCYNMEHFSLKVKIKKQVALKDWTQKRLFSLVHVINYTHVTINKSIHNIEYFWATIFLSLTFKTTDQKKVEATETCE